MDMIGTAVDFIFDAVFTEAFAVFFLVGAIIFLIGLALLGLFAVSRLSGKRVAGVVAGAVQVVKHKTKMRDGELVEKVKETLFPVYEYTCSAGKKRQMRGSEGGTMTLKYTTGQAVNLIVREDDEYDDVYDADEYGAIYIGLGMLVCGAGLMIWVGNSAAAFGIGVLAMMVAVVGFFLSGIAKKMTGPTEPTKKKTRREYSAVQPIEFYRELKANRVTD